MVQLLFSQDQEEDEDRAQRSRGLSARDENVGRFSKPAPAVDSSGPKNSVDQLGVTLSEDSGDSQGPVVCSLVQSKLDFAFLQMNQIHHS